jgi:hypothetical protein
MFSNETNKLIIKTISKYDSTINLLILNTIKNEKSN